MMLLAAAGIGIAALLTDLIAVRLGSAALAGLPLLLLFTEPFTLSVSRGFARHHARVLRQRRRVPGAAVERGAGTASASGSSRTRPPSNEPDTRTARRRGTAGRVRLRRASRSACRCSSPGCTPPGCSATGSRGSAARAACGAAAGRVGFPDPNVQLSQELTQRRSRRPCSPTRTTNSRLPADLHARQAHGRGLAAVRPARVPGPGQPAAARAARPPVARRRRPANHDVTLASDVGQDYLAALPVPYPATTVTASGTLQADKSTLMVFDPGVSLGGLSYTVTSLPEAPGDQVLSAAPPPPRPSRRITCRSPRTTTRCAPWR